MATDVKSVSPVVCTSLVGIEYSGPESFDPSVTPALIVGGVTALVASMAAWFAIGPQENSPKCCNDPLNSQLVRQRVRIVGGERLLAPPKGRKEREVPLPEVVAVAISERLRQYRTVDGLVFTSHNAELLHRTRYNNGIWKPALRAAGVEPTRENGMHALRHHYASVLLEGGVSIRALADYLGHSDPGFTLRVYAHLMPESEDRTRSVVDASLGAFAESTRNVGLPNA